MELKHVISAKGFNTSSLQLIFSLADNIKNNKFNPRTLAGKIMATLFYEPSTRTRLSFESAMLRLGGTYIATENASEFSSAIKGETLEDTIRIVNFYSDIIVLRHPNSGASEIAAKYSKIPIINAGDGNGEHPTQALLDLYTIFSKFRKKTFEIAMVGDMANYRSSHSLSYLLSLYPQIKISYVSPKKLSIPKNLKNHLIKKKVKFKEVENLEEGIKNVDVIYQTRIPKEYQSASDYKKYKGKYVIDKQTLRKISKNSLIMHPLPRVDEITSDVDSDPRAIYFEQARNGIFIRMALLLILFDKSS